MAFVIYTDSGCDLSEEMLDLWGIKAIPLSFVFDDDGINISNYEMSPKEFFDRMRDGGVAKTAGVNIQEFLDLFEETLEQGDDILYLGFSSTLSSTFSCANQAAMICEEDYPDQKIYVCDTVGASAGQAIMLYYAKKMRDEGATIEEVRDFVEENKLKVCHWFIVDDLQYLLRGGRISKSSAVVGEMLNIKPVLHLDEQGVISATSKALGRKAALKTLEKKYEELAADKEKGLIAISHADCEEQARQFGDALQEKFGAREILYANIGPVLGAHAGPGTIALFFLGDKR